MKPTNIRLLKIERGDVYLQVQANQQHREFYLTKEQCIDLISGYRTDMRIRINRRWQIETMLPTKKTKLSLNSNKP